MNAQTKKMIRDWLQMHNGDVEGLARWMRDSANIGGIKACRALIEEYQALEYAQRQYERELAA